MMNPWVLLICGTTLTVVDAVAPKEHASCLLSAAEILYAIAASIFYE